MSLVGLIFNDGYKKIMNFFLSNFKFSILIFLLNGKYDFDWSIQRVTISDHPPNWWNHRCNFSQTKRKRGLAGILIEFYTVRALKDAFFRSLLFIFGVACVGVYGRLNKIAFSKIGAIVTIQWLYLLIVRIPN